MKFSALFAVLFALVLALPSQAIVGTLNPQGVNSKIKNNLTITGSLNFGGITIPATSDLLTTSGNANQQIAKGRIFDEPLVALPLSTTTQVAFGQGRAGTVTNVTVGAVTKPTATSSCTVQVFKNTTSNPVTAVFDLNSITTNGVGQTITITGNQTLTATDFLFAQAVTGASLNSMNGAYVSVEVLTTDY